MAVQPITGSGVIRRQYLAVGHITIDRFADGRESLGGSALYSALLAARCGLDAAILTSGNVEILGEKLGEVADVLDVMVQHQEAVTTLLTHGVGKDRRQRLLTRAGDVGVVRTVTDILHLAPVIREV